jgi:membrane fusion protein (multidrug efflux system)
MSVLRTPVAVALLLLMPAGLAVAQDMPPKSVGVVELQRQEVPRVVTLPGRAVAAAAAAIRPRVGGIVTEILYTAGRPLKAGDPMFRIDNTTYSANLSSAEAEVASAQASLLEAELAFDRTQRLLGSGTSQSQVDTARATLEKARASVQAAEAAQRLAQAELDWTTVTSPIDGMASVAQISVGDLVTAGQADALATVTQLDPIEVDMFEPSARILSVLNDISEGRLKVRDEIKAELTLETGQTYEVTGELVAPGFTVSTSTGAVDSRFRFDNPRYLLLPGMFLRGQVDLGTMQAFLVSQSAATRDKTGQLSAWVIEDGKAVKRSLTDYGTWQHSWIVTDGINDGDLLAVDGLTGLTEGTEVTTLPVTFDENGVVREVPQDDAPKAAE